MKARKTAGWGAWAALALAASASGQGTGGADVGLPAAPASERKSPADRGEPTGIAAPPIVRLPVPAESAVDGRTSGTGALGSAGSVADRAAERRDSERTGDGEGGRPTSVGFQTGTLDLRSPPVSPLRTNGPVELKGPVPKLMRPQRRTFGGFMSSFANLFNPLAPVGSGESSTEEHRYDGRVNRSPLPASFRDERFHEPQALIIGVGLDGEAKKVEDKDTVPPKTPVR